jgi:hypothetical protein
MPRIQLIPDTLDPETERFAPAPLREPLFMTSLQKSGTHLLRNILRMFIPLEQQYRGGYIQAQNFGQHLDAFDPSRKLFSFGHLRFTPAAAVQLSEIRKLLLYRDPYDWVLARARFFVSDQFDGDMPFLKRIGTDELLSVMIFGLAGKIPDVSTSYERFIVPWLGAQSVHAIRYEELAEHSSNVGTKAAEAYFSTLFGTAGIDRPDDWRERTKVGADPARSGTARANLTGIRVDLPDELSQRHRRLVDYAAPGLRELLGYA